MLHTIDHAARSGANERSQAIRWLALSFVHYICDRIFMRTNHRYQARVFSAKLAETACFGAKIIVLKIEKPTRFHFQPGQYAYLRVPSIDHQNWHPFSIASASDSSFLEFIIEVCGEDSWTEQLWQYCSDFVQDKSQSRVIAHSFRLRSNLIVDVMGPYGSSYGHLKDYSHAIAIGSGTGIVPMISIFKQHARDLTRLNPSTYFHDEEKRTMKVNKEYRVQRRVDGSLYRKFRNIYKQRDQLNHSLSPNDALSLSNLSIGSLASSHQTSKLRRREISFSIDNLPGGKPDADQMKAIQKAASMAALPVYGIFLSLCIPILGVSMIALTFSWNILPSYTITIDNAQEIPIDLDARMGSILFAGTLFFHLFFFVEAVVLHNVAELLTYTDFVLSALCFFMDYRWIKHESWGNVDEDDLALTLLLLGYCTMRSWFTVVNTTCNYYGVISMHDKSPTLRKLHLVWVTRSASLVSKLRTDLDDVWSSLCNQWGEENVKRVCDMSIFVTDRNKKDCDVLKAETNDTVIGGKIQFERPNFQKLIDSSIIDRVNEATHHEGMYCSNTLVTFCGSPVLGQRVRKAAFATEIASMLTGNAYHKIEHISESYGVKKAQEKRN
mmetsp:Transcript_22356/g.34292  ORF Transcript_22356/g.34292 Transcript_22356/m.34292 type:complete len:610 (-) Transcript_22356:311-2140(-)